MTSVAFFLVFASAVLHATWNMMAKKTGASLAFYAVLETVGAFWSFAVWFLTPIRYFAMPAAFHGWLAAMLVSELLYATGLRLSYRALDMSAAYPLMRAIPLPLLAIITSVCSFGKPVGCIAALGMAMVFAGCLLVPLRRFGDFSPSRYLDRNFLFIAMVALGTTGYTLCDSQAQRVMMAAAPGVSRPMVSLTYYAFRMATLVPMLWLVVFCGRESRAEAVELWRARSWIPPVAGCCSFLTYMLVLVSMNFVTNVAYVQALRQIGLVFGLLGGVFVLKERCHAPKVLGVVLILVGIATMMLQ